MQISKLQLKNFKRFSDLTIDLTSCASSPKLVLLIGANGSGKSAVFDAFELLATFNKTQSFSGGRDFPYYLRNAEEGFISAWFDNENFINCTLQKSQNGGFSESNTDFSLTSFYGRSAVRYLSKITRTVLGQIVNIEKNTDKPIYYIDNDIRFENDLDVLMWDIIENVFKGINLSSPERIDEINAFLNRINEALLRIFGENEKTSLRFISLLPPADGNPIKLMFRKGASEINYDFLSSGEKEVINILFNLFVRTPKFQDTIYFFDEMDSHLNTALQYDLLKEIAENWIPANCQLWTASHSLGFIQYAQQSENAVIIDFDNYNFDEQIILTPKETQDVFDIAVPIESLEILFKDKIKVFCEGQDSLRFNTIGFSNTLFLGEFDKQRVFMRAETDKNVFGLIDRDYLTDDEMGKLTSNFPNLVILEYYSIENYLFHPDNLIEIFPEFDKVNYVAEITKEKNRLKNDIKSKMRNDRNSYIFFQKNYLNQTSTSFDNLFKTLDSDEFENFYKIFKMKGKANLCNIPNIGKFENSLVKTKWFKEQVSSLFEKSGIEIN